MKFACPKCRQLVSEMPGPSPVIGENFTCTSCGHVWNFMPGGDVSANYMSERTGPFTWRDLDGNDHIEIPKLLALFELPDTAENRIRVQDILTEAINLKSKSAKFKIRV